MSLAIDTNIFMYAHFEDFDQHKKAKSALSAYLASDQPCFISWQIYYEYIRLATHPKVLKKPLSLEAASKDMDFYLNAGFIHCLSESASHNLYLKKVTKGISGCRGNFIHDCHFAALLNEQAIKKILTCDTDFKKFDFLEVINPISE